MGLARGLLSCLLGAAASLSGLSWAQAEPRPINVWYRNSEGCPDGASFSARLAELGHVVRLAQVGDRVDFVVTIGRSDAVSSGRLERQTQTGIVAVREYRDVRCDDVAEALALTLDLALAPDEQAPAEPDPPRSAPPPAALVGARDAVSPPPPPAAARRAPWWTIGAQGTLLTGAAPSPLLGAAVFGALEHPDWLVRYFRATLHGAHADGQGSGRDLRVTLVGLRLEACPLWWHARWMTAGLCAALEGGAIHAAGEDALGVSDTGYWAAGVALGRVALDLSSALAIEVQLGASAPLVRHEMGPRDASAVWFRTQALGAAAGVGLAWKIE